MSSEPKVLSLIVPTRDRSQYAVRCIETLLRIPAGDLEIVVSDNSEDDATQSALDPWRDDTRLVYSRIREPIDMAANFTRAIQLSSGTYVGILGDDDGVTSDVVEVARWARRAGYQAVGNRGRAIYFWPDVSLSVYGSRFSAALRIWPFTGGVEHPDAMEQLVRVAARGGTEFGGLPRVYLGLAARAKLEEIASRAGTYFPGPSPDMASAVALASVIDRYVLLDRPVFFSGTGRRSGGGAGAMKEHDWSLEAVPWLSRSAIEQWSPQTPRVAVGPTLWAESVIQAARAMGEDEALAHFNHAALQGRLAVFHPHHWEVIGRSFLNGPGGLRAGAGFLTGFIRAWAQRLRSLVENVSLIVGFGSVTLIHRLADVGEATEALDRVVFGGSGGRSSLAREAHTDIE